MMTMRILWPNMPAEFEQIARDAVGPGFETDFCAISRCDRRAMGRTRTPSSVLPAAAIYRQAAQMPDLRQAGRRLRRSRHVRQDGHRICDTPDYGTREVAEPHGLPHDACQEHRLPRRHVGPTSRRHTHDPFGRRLSVCAFGVVGMGRIGERPRLAAPRPSTWTSSSRPSTAERLRAGNRRPPRRHAGRAYRPVRFRQHPRAAQRGDAQPDRARRVRRPRSAV